MSLSIDTIDPQELELLLAQVAARRKAEREVRKAQRSRKVSFCTNLARVVSETFGPPRTFTSGATGWQIASDTSDGKYRVSILVREIATIPAKDEPAKETSEPAEF